MGSAVGVSSLPWVLADTLDECLIHVVLFSIDWVCWACLVAVSWQLPVEWVLILEWHFPLQNLNAFRRSGKGKIWI
jgi:hypothetical protein